MDKVIKKFQLELPPALHKQIKAEAVQAGMSMNQYMLEIIMKRKK